MYATVHIIAPPINWLDTLLFSITSAITDNFLSTLVQPPEIIEINSLDDLLESNLKLLIPTGIEKKLHDNNFKLWTRLNATIKSIPWQEFLNIADLWNPSFTYATIEPVTEYILHANLDKVTKKPIYYKLDECIFDMHAAYHCDKVRCSVL